MPTGHLTSINWKGQIYMPINLKRVLQQAGVKQQRWCESVKQMSGKPLSLSAGNQILNFKDWPTLTPVHSIKQQTESLLREAGVTEEQLATIWETDEGDSARQQHPVGVHELQHANKKTVNTYETLEPEMLSDEAKNQFNIARDPFKDDINGEEDVFITPEIRKVRNAMFLTATLGGILAVVSQSGGGKTVLRRDFFDRLERESAPVRVIMPKTFDKRALSSNHVCEAIIAALQPEEKMKRTIEGRARQAENILIASMQAGSKHVIVIEEAHDLTDSMLKLLKRFWEMEKGLKKLLSIILVGQNELDLKLDARANPTVREFINRCEKITLPPLDAHLEAYLKFKFKRVGTSFDSVFDKSAIDGIRERLTYRRGNAIDSDVYPLVVNNLVTKAMNFCAQAGVPKVNADVIKSLR